MISRDCPTRFKGERKGVPEKITRSLEFICNLPKPSFKNGILYGWA
jgi:hypothetical protein